MRCNLGLKFQSLDIQSLQLLIEFFQPHSEFEVVSGSFSNAHVPPRIEAPTLRLDFIERGDLAKAEHVCILSLWETVLHQVAASGLGLCFLAATQADNVRQEFNLLRFELAMCPVNLREDVTCVDEENFVL